MLARGMSEGRVQGEFSDHVCMTSDVGSSGEL